MRRSQTTSTPIGRILQDSPPPYPALSCVSLLISAGRRRVAVVGGSRTAPTGDVHDTQDNQGVIPTLSLPIPVNSRLSPDKTPVGAVREPPTTRPLQRLRDAGINKDRPG